MTEIIEVSLPKLGESIVNATVVQWLKKTGDQVAVDEALLEVSTDKVNSEIPSPVAGVVKEILVKVDEEIEVGTPLLKIEVDAVAPYAPALETARAHAVPCSARKGKEEVFTPAVLRLAQMEGIAFETLRKIDGSGEGGRITKKDVERFAANKRTPPNPVEQEGEERIRLSGMRKMIADNMVRSFYEAPHASLVSEADVTDVMRLIVQEKERFKQTHGVKLTITSFLIQALTKALRQFPMLNASLEEETIIMKRFINVGIAVNVDKGLIVPVIKNCHERNLVSLARSVADLSSRARTGKLSADEVSGGTVTLTNFGMTGALIGVPIIRYPEVAIIGAGTIQKRVVVREDDSLAVRQMIYLTLTFDHRIIDGIYGCQFLAAFKHHLESI
ncbi:MAG: 2-oxo acid dehydrogenase subunit E2 [Chlamydiales bacterium]|nr:2-oxo acid dehydrogenase subunit E2 [Chlamydiales bacterium]